MTAADLEPGPPSILVHHSNHYSTLIQTTDLPWSFSSIAPAVVPINHSLALRTCQTPHTKFHSCTRCWSVLRIRNPWLQHWCTSEVASFPGASLKPAHWPEPHSLSPQLTFENNSQSIKISSSTPFSALLITPSQFAFFKMGVRGVPTHTHTKERCP